MRLATDERMDGCAARLAKCGEVDVRGEKVEERREREATRANTIVKLFNQIGSREEIVRKEKKNLGER